ncbi:LOW QUALITY PROTEIN: protein POLYCHOME [Actinidia eriantha]|uniref:LOW QUALITY PROTEIN: protein POLYCHOME n=1 Tax=Actinidia eriantha TaxID=165200 RepID=UPI0025901A95|nr:LOW QUALITY PROTEIN: protein POLYCHOME [Actinidia eriantha]
MFSRRSQLIGGIAFLLDEPEVVIEAPIRWGSTGMTGTRGTTALVATRSGRGGSTSSVLPSWYPRTPLHDITAVAIERRRARLRETEGQQTESPVPQDQNVLSPSVPISGAQLEHDFPTITPDHIIGKKPFQLSVGNGKVPKMLLDITNQNAGESSDCLTPQKKLLNSIDTVEKVVMEELKKLKRTPSAKKVEREKRVRTLMSMR